MQSTSVTKKISLDPDTCEVSGTLSPCTATELSPILSCPYLQGNIFGGVECMANYDKWVTAISNHLS